MLALLTAAVSNAVGRWWIDHVIYARRGLALWASNTWQHPGARLVVQDDGNVVIYRPDGTPVWVTNTAQR